MPNEDSPALLGNATVCRGTRPGEASVVTPLFQATEQDTRSGAGPGGLLTDKLHKLSTAGPSLEAELRLALQTPVTEFVLHYQPVLDLTSGKVVGVEALVRWQHPSRGLLGPDEFIALAEDNGLINHLGDWALGQAVRDAATLTHQVRELDMAINFSVRQLDDHIVAKVQQALESSGVRAGRLTVEVTESAFVKDEGITAATYEAMSTMGVKFAIDDFGTSFSSLLHLRRYPIAALKLDGAVVAGIGERAEDEAICESIISLARAVGASTVGEGIETTEQYAVLRSMGCVRGQGYLWSRWRRGGRGCRAHPNPLSVEATSLIAQMHHVEGASTHAIAEALNRTVGRHPSGVRWTAGAVARGLPAASEQPAGAAEAPPNR